MAVDPLKMGYERVKEVMLPQHPPPPPRLK